MTFCRIFLLGLILWHLFLTPDWVLWLIQWPFSPFFLPSSFFSIFARLMEKIRLQKIVLYFHWLSLVRPDAFVYFRNIWNARMNLFRGKKNSSSLFLWHRRIKYHDEMIYWLIELAYDWTVLGYIKHINLCKNSNMVLNNQLDHGGWERGSNSGK